MALFRRGDDEADAQPEPAPFRWSDVEARIARVERINDFARSAEIIWAPILASLQAEQRRMKERGLL